VLVLWVLQMGLLLRHLQASPANLAADLARYGSEAQWKGVYYRGEKIGFSVGQVVPSGDGYELQEDGRLQMILLGASSAARIKTVARVDRDFNLKSFSFSLDPGSGPLEINGTIEGRRLSLTVKGPGGARSETRELADAPMLSLNLSRRLAAAGLRSGDRHVMTVFDPATLRNAPMVLDVGPREVVRAADKPVPAFKVKMTFAGITSTSWVTDTGEVVREESPMGLLVVKEARNRALALAVPGHIQMDLLQAAAVVPTGSKRIDETTAVVLMQLRLEGMDPSSPDLRGGSQTLTENVMVLRDPRSLKPGAPDPDAQRFLEAEPLIESDAPEIVAEAQAATRGVTGPRQKAERLVRHVNHLLEKKPTVSVPSALEVLRTRVGDCNEHTALYVALARSQRIPARIAVGLVYLHGAFYYHAWPEVYLAEGGGGLWLPVDPTLNQFPSDATHLRLARGGLDRQAAILPLIGNLKITIMDVQLQPGATPTLVGRPVHDMRPLEIALPQRGGGGTTCWSSPR
jgi:hypothetical protein